MSIIAADSSPAEYVREQIRIARSLTSCPTGVNIMLMSTHADDVAQECVEAVTTGAGKPAKYMAA